jgi:hypothetical protein
LLIPELNSVAVASEHELPVYFGEESTEYLLGSSALPHVFAIAYILLNQAGMA